MKLTDGVHGITSETYHTSDGLSRSQLMDYLKSPLHFYHKHLSGEYKAYDSAAFYLGSMVHCLVLEPHLFDLQYYQMPNCDRRTKAGKELYSHALVDAGTRIIVTHDDIVLAQAMADAFNRHNLAPSLLADAEIEQSIYFTHTPTGLQCKVRPDIWQGSIVSDLKTTQDASYRAFQSSAFKYGYYLQAGMIDCALKSLGQTLEKFVFIAVEKDAPHAIAIYILEEDAILYGAQQFYKLMDKINVNISMNNWPDYGVQTLALPGYAKFEFEGE